MWVTKLLISPVRIRVFLPKNDQIWSKMCIFSHFGPNVAIFLHILSNARPKTNMNKVPRWVFRCVGNKTFHFSSKKKDFFAPKRPNLA